MSGAENLNPDGGPLDPPRAIANDIEAFKARPAPRVKDFDRTPFVAEASDGYRRELADFLRSHGLSVAVVNPHRVRAFAVSIGAAAKTDAIEGLIDENLGRLKARRRDLDSRITRAVKVDESSNRTAEILRSVSGVGPRLTSTILAEPPEIGTLSGGGDRRADRGDRRDDRGGPDQPRFGQTPRATPHRRGPVACPQGAIRGDVVDRTAVEGEQPGRRGEGRDLNKLAFVPPDPCEIENTVSPSRSEAGGG